MEDFETMEYKYEDVSIGDMYEHKEGGFYLVTEKDHGLFVSHKPYAKRPKDEFHYTEGIKVLYKRH